MKVEKTTDYGQFKKIKGNRVFAVRHLKNLIASIASNNLLQYTPIIVNEQMEIVDGQHRLAAAKKLGVPIYYVQVDKGDLNDVISINANLKSWTLADYLESQVLLGIKDYQILNEYVDKYKLPIGISIRLLMGVKANSGSNSTVKMGGGAVSSATRVFKEGNFKVTNLEEAEFIGKKAQEIAPYTEVGVWKDRNFIEALTTVYANVKPSAFIDAVSRSGMKISKKSKVRDYLIYFEDIYNFRKSTGRQKFY